MGRIEKGRGENRREGGTDRKAAMEGIKGTEGEREKTVEREEAARVRGSGESERKEESEERGKREEVREGGRG